MLCSHIHMKACRKKTNINISIGWWWFRRAKQTSTAHDSYIQWIQTFRPCFIFGQHIATQCQRIDIFLFILYSVCLSSVGLQLVNQLFCDLVDFLSSCFFLLCIVFYQLCSRSGHKCSLNCVRECLHENYFEHDLAYHFVVPPILNITYSCIWIIYCVLCVCVCACVPNERYRWRIATFLVENEKILVCIAARNPNWAAMKWNWLARMSHPCNMQWICRHRAQTDTDRNTFGTYSHTLAQIRQALAHWHRLPPSVQYKYQSIDLLKTIWNMNDFFAVHNCTWNVGRDRKLEKAQIETMSNIVFILSVIAVLRTM